MYAAPHVGQRRVRKLGVGVIAVFERWLHDLLPAKHAKTASFGLHRFFSWAKGEVGQDDAEAHTGRCIHRMPDRTARLDADQPDLLMPVNPAFRPRRTVTPGTSMKDAIPRALFAGRALTVEEFCTRDVVHIETLESVAKAARLMHERQIGSVVIVEKDGKVTRPVGIITDRDIAVRVVAGGRDPRQTTIGDVMTRDPKCVSADEPIGRALEVMESSQVRRIPVIDGAGKLVGIIAQADIATRLNDDNATGEVVEAISRQ